MGARRWHVALGLVLAAVAIQGLPLDEERLIGWQGEINRGAGKRNNKRQRRQIIPKIKARVGLEDVDKGGEPVVDSVNSYGHKGRSNENISSGAVKAGGGSGIVQAGGGSGMVLGSKDGAGGDAAAGAGGDSRDNDSSGGSSSSSGGRSGSSRGGSSGNSSSSSGGGGGGSSSSIGGSSMSTDQGSSKGDGEVSSPGERSKQAWVQQVSWEPRVFIYHNMLSPEEAVHIRMLAAPTMKRSSVVGTNGSAVIDSHRTSYGTFIRRNKSPILTAVEERVASWLGLPPVHQEDMQVLRYAIGQEYKAHTDSLIDSSPRVATLLIYLHDVEEGGETAFPDAGNWTNPEVAKSLGPFSECARGHIAFKPMMGDALLFYSNLPDGQHDPLSLHTGCPVVKGVKWTATVWSHTLPFRPSTFNNEAAGDDVDPGECSDASGTKSCALWTDKGECEKNPAFMTGPSGHCRASCKACEACGDLTGDECYNRNREEAGYLSYDRKTFI